MTNANVFAAGVVSAFTGSRLARDTELNRRSASARRLRVAPLPNRRRSPRFTLPVPPPAYGAQLQ